MTNNKNNNDEEKHTIQKYFIIFLSRFNLSVQSTVYTQIIIYIVFSWLLVLELFCLCVYGIMNVKTGKHFDRHSGENGLLPFFFVEFFPGGFHAIFIHKINAKKKI